MTSELLRLDWYSFLMGTQISATSGILTSSAQSANRLRFQREYLSSSFHSGGNTIFLYKIKENGNWYKVWLKFVSKIVEKNIIGGFMYAVLNQSLNDLHNQNANITRMRAFFFGGILGVYFSFRYNWDLSMWEGIASGLSAAELTVSGEEVRRLILEDNMLKPEDFVIPLTYDNASFLSGAFTGCIHGMLYSSFIDNLDEVHFPSFEDDDSSLQHIFKCVQLCYSVTARLTKVNLFFFERYIVGGVFYCVFEFFAKKITGTKESFNVAPIPGLLLGVYLAIDSANFQRSWKSLASTACGIRAIFFMVRAIQSFTNGQSIKN